MDEYEPNPVVPKPATAKVEARNFAPQGESIDSIKNDNDTHWEAFIGSGYWVRLSTWVKNQKKYVSLRKNQNIGANIEAQYLDCIIVALQAMRAECLHILPVLETPA
jgi:hypothetical protein